MKIGKNMQPQRWSESAECHVSGSLKWMFRVSQLVGVAPVRFDGRRVSVSRGVHAVHCIVMTVLNILGIYATVKDLATDLKDTVRVSKSSEKILWAVDYCFVMFIASVGAYNGFSRVTELLKCLSRVQKIKKEIITDQDKEFKCCEKKNCSILVSFLVFATTTVILDYRRIFIKAIKTRKDIIVTSLYSCYEAAYVMLFMLEMQFLFSSLEIYEALKTLNNALERASQQKTVVRSFMSNETKTDERTIQRLALTHNVLCVVMKRLEGCFSFILVVLVSSCLVHLVMSSNHTIRSFLRGRSEEPLLDVAWCILHLVRTLVIIEPSHYTQVEMDRTRLLVSQIILHNTDALMAEELDKFYRYLLLNKTSYAPMALCTLSRSLLATMLGSVATYLVIIVQLSAVEAAMKNKKKVQQKPEWTDQAKCTVSMSMSCMFRISQFIGIAPVLFDGRCIRVSQTLFVVHCTAMTVMNILAFSALCVDMNLAVDRSMRVQRNVDRILWIMDFSAVMFIASMAAYGAKSRVTEVIKCLSRVQKIKKAINCHQETETVWHEKKKCCFLLTFLLFSSSLLSIEYAYNILADVLHRGKNPIVAIFYSGYEVSYILMYMVEMQFVFTALEVHEAYKRLNYALENISHSKPVQNVSATRNPTMTVEESIHRLASAYTNLGLVVKRLEKAFSAILILLLLSVLLHLVISPYQWISFLTTKDRVNYVQLTLELFWNILHITRAVLVVEPPHLTQVEMDRTQTLVSQMILQNHDIQVSEELDKFYRHILMNKVTYTPMGICTLQRPLLASILSNAVTYLVIIIQFKLLELSS